jgi:hypothetical protein
MRRPVASLLLWLFVINLGTAFGAGLFESRVLVPQWLSGSVQSGYRWNAEAARQANTGLAFWVYVTTVPLTLLTIGNLIAAWQTSGALRRWWLAAGVAAVADRAFTFGYFIPTMVRLMRLESAADPETVATATQWVQWDYARHAITLAAWLLALKAFAVFYQAGRSSSAAAAAATGPGPSVPS